MPATKFKNNYLPELNAFLLGRKKPSMVSVNLTSRCNQNCIYCELGQNITAPEGEMITKDDLFWIVDQMKTSNITKLSMCGGEPFLFFDIIAVVDDAGRKEIRCNITSNGMTIHRLTEKEIHVLKTYNTSINISVDSFRQDIQAKTRGSDQALVNAVKSIDKLNRNGIPVTILSAISKYNFHDLFSSLVSAYESGVSEVLYQPLIYYSNYPDEPVIANKSELNVPVENLDILMDQLKKIHQFEKRHKINTNVYRILPWIRQYLIGAADPDGDWFFRDILKRFYCRETDAVIDISYSGGIQPCGLSKSGISIKNKRNESLIKLWFEATGKLRTDLADNKLPLICNGCCHKFSRNLYASVMKYPIANRSALINLIFPAISRIILKFYKSIFVLN